MKKKRIPKKTDPETVITREFPQRLAELEIELQRHPERPAGEQPLKAISAIKEILIDGEKALQFALGSKVYAAGHADVTHAGSNHARGVRHIRFYAQGQTVLTIEGDFEDQQFGSNFRFQTMPLYVPGVWEADFQKLSDDLRLHTAKRRIAFKKKRTAERAQQNRRH